MVKMKARKIIKLIIAILLGLAVLLGAFWGVLTIDEAIKSIVDSDGLLCDSKTLVTEMKGRGYYVDPNLFIEGTEKTSSYLMETLYYKLLKPTISSTFVLEYQTFEYDYENYENIYIPGCSSKGILGINIEVETNYVRTFYEQLAQKKQIERDYGQLMIRHDVVEEEIAGAPTLLIFGVSKYYDFYEGFSVRAESKVAKDVLVTTLVSWKIDLDTYDYEFMTQQARDFVEFVIRNVEPPVY